MTVNDIIKWRVTVICGGNEPQNIPHQPYYQTVTQMHLGISSVNRGTYHLAIYTGGEIFLILSFDWLVLSFFYVTFFYGFYGDLVFFSSPPGYGLFQFIFWQGSEWVWLIARFLISCQGSEFLFCFWFLSFFSRRKKKWIEEKKREKRGFWDLWLIISRDSFRLVSKSIGSREFKNAPRKGKGKIF